MPIIFYVQTKYSKISKMFTRIKYNILCQTIISKSFEREIRKKNLKQHFTRNLCDSVSAISDRRQAFAWMMNFSLSVMSFSLLQQQKEKVKNSSLKIRDNAHEQHGLDGTFAVFPIFGQSIYTLFLTQWPKGCSSTKGHKKSSLQ